MKGVHKTALRVYTNHIHPRSHGSTADLYHNTQLIVNYVFTVLKRTPQLSSNYGRQNCVTEINCVLCCKSQQDCAMVRKMQRRHAQMQRCRAQMQRYRAQNAETSCSNLMQRYRAQNAETSCSKCRDAVLKNAETSCSKSRDAVLKMRRCRAQNAERRAQNAGELTRKTLCRVIPAGRTYLQHVSYYSI